ncbi:MAG: cobalamin-dependent protein [Actinomycetota bacterium]|nr:cobalamin-dependent protein [Actinomycetota bacterium]
MIAKLGFDAHWRGVIIIANALRDAGMEVVYLGHASAEDIAAAVVQEDAILLGLSTLSGNHLGECPSVMEQLRSAGADDVVVVLGGTIPTADVPALEADGVAAVFPTGSSVPDLLVLIEELVVEQDAARRKAG